jgi:hypothetical protein
MAGRILPATIPEWMQGVCSFMTRGKLPETLKTIPFLTGDPRQLQKTRLESRYRQPAMMVRDFAREKIPLQEMIAPLAPALPPWGAGAHFATPALPEREILPRLRTGTTAQSQPGMAERRGHVFMPSGASGLVKDFFRAWDFYRINRNILERDNVPPWLAGYGFSMSMMSPVSWK